MATQTEWVGLAALGGIAVLFLTRRSAPASSSGGATTQQFQSLQRQLTSASNTTSVTPTTGTAGSGTSSLPTLPWLGASDGRTVIRYNGLAIDIPGVYAPGSVVTINGTMYRLVASANTMSATGSAASTESTPAVSGAYTTPVTKTSIPYQYNPSIPSVVTSSGQTSPVASSTTLNGVRVSVFNEGDVTQPGSSAATLYQYALSNPQFVKGQLAAAQATGQINSAVLQAAQTLGLVSAA